MSEALAIESDAFCTVGCNVVRLQFIDGSDRDPEVLTPREARVVAARLLAAADEAEAQYDRAKGVLR